MKNQIAQNDQLTLDIQLCADFQFENFVQGNNQQLIEQLQNLSELSSGVFLWGTQSSGKTHLLNALCQRYQKNNTSAQVMYLPLGADIVPESLDGMEQCALVCLDNLDRVFEQHTDQSAWEQALFNFINRMSDLGKYFVLCSSLPLAELNILLPDLQSRLGAALHFEVVALDADHAIELFCLKAKERGIGLEQGVLSYMAKRGPRDVKSLLLLLDVLDEQSLKAKKVITVPFLKQCIDW